MDAFESFHPVPAAWLRDSDLAPFIPAYVRRLVDRHYAAVGCLQPLKSSQTGLPL